MLTIIGLLHAQTQTLTQIKAELEKTPDPIGYVKFKLKKKFKIDTITIISTSHFMGIADSLAYRGKVGKVYGPFKNEKVLVKILGKAPNIFYHASQILLDTTIFRKKFADSLSSDIIKRIQNGTATFEDMAKTYSHDPSSATGGDMGWFIGRVMIPEFDKAIVSHKKGELFKIWTSA